MATYILDERGSAYLPRRPLAVTLAVGGTPTCRAKLIATVGDSRDAPALRHTPSMLIIPRVDQEITIAAVPEDGRDRFDQNTILHVDIGPDSAADAEADSAQLNPRDVSGLRRIELATIAPAGPDRVVVTTRLMVADAPLPALAARARVACRGVLGVDQLAEHQQMAVHCVLDTSTSMAALFSSGAVAAAAHLVAGIAAVVSGPSRPIPTVLAGVGGGQHALVAGSELGAHTMTVAASTGFGIGPDLNAAARHLNPKGALTVIVTDAPAPPLPATVGCAISWLVLSAARSGLRYPGFVGAVCPPPPAGTPPDAFLTANPAVVEDIVAGLLAPLVNGVVPR